MPRATAELIASGQAQRALKTGARAADDRALDCVVYGDGGVLASLRRTALHSSSSAMRL